MKTCNKCGEELDYSEFNKDGKIIDGYSGTCRKCSSYIRKLRREGKPLTGIYASNWSIKKQRTKENATIHFNRKANRYVRRWYENGRRVGITNAKWVWEMEHGEVPKGYEIHHIDRDTTNDELSNLECLTVKEHGERHRKYQHKFIDDIEYKYCETCESWKTLDNFTKSKSYLHTKCKSCKNEYNKQYYKKNREKHPEKYEEYYKTNNERRQKDVSRLQQSANG